MRDLLLEYIEGKTDVISVIRAISGIVNMDHAINVLAIICMITRVEQGDLDKETFKAILLEEKSEG
jgi:hypothetical protein